MKKAIKNMLILAYASCAGNLAANIAKDCDHPLVGGYTGRGLLIPLSNRLNFSVDATNPRIITGITMGQDDKLAIIDNVWPSAFTDSVTQSNADAGRLQYNKGFTFRIPLRGAGVSKNIVEPLADAPLGYMAVLEKKDRVGDGSYEVVGYGQGLTVNPDGIVRNENENGGDIVVTMSCQEQFFEVTLFDTNYETTRAAFEALLAQSF
jgi:hypothetical protein